MRRSQKPEVEMHLSTLNFLLFSFLAYAQRAGAPQRARR